MKHWLTTIVTILLLVVLASTGAYAGERVETTNGGLLATVGSGKNVYKGNVTLSHLAPADCRACWLYGNDLPLGRPKRFASTSIVFRLMLNGAPDDQAKRFKMRVRIAGREPVDFHYNATEHLWLTDPVGPEYFKGVDGVEVLWREGRGERPYIRAIVKITAPWGNPVQDSTSFMLETIQDPCPREQMTGAVVAQAYRRYQGIDPTLGGGVTDPALLLGTSVYPQGQAASQPTVMSGQNNAAMMATLGEIKGAIGDLTSRTDILDQRLRAVEAGGNACQAAPPAVVSSTPPATSSLCARVVVKICGVCDGWSYQLEDDCGQKSPNGRFYLSQGIDVININLSGTGSFRIRIFDAERNCWGTWMAVSAVSGTYTYLFPQGGGQ